MVCRSLPRERLSSRVVALGAIRTSRRVKSLHHLPCGAFRAEPALKDLGDPAITSASISAEPKNQKAVGHFDAREMLRSANAD